jgi:protein involved in polysaccharide export with SLBB domain
VLAIPAYTPLSIALARSGGLQADASLRRIRILSQDQPPREIDLYGLLLGDPDFREPLLAEGDRVFVPPSGGSIAINGVVPRYGIFELPQGQESISVSDALGLSGLSLVPQGLPLERIFFAQDGLPVSVVVTDPDITQIKSGEALRVGMVKAVTQGDVSVLGAVIEPFSQAFVAGLKLSSVLKGGAVLAPEADGDFVVLLAPRGSGPEPFRLVPIKAIQSGMDDPILVPGSKILVPSLGQVEAMLRSVSGTGNAGLSALEKSIADNIVVAAPSQVFVDGLLVALVPPGVEAGLIDRFVVVMARNKIYESYALIEGQDGSLRSVGFSANANNSLLNFKPERATRLHLFSRQFLSSNLQGAVDEAVVNLSTEEIGENAAIDDKIYRRLASDTRLVRGEVSEPGAYPVSGRTTLADMLFTAGGVLPSGDASAIILRQYRVDGGVLSLAAERTIDTTRVDPSTVALNGIFGILVQPLINDALVGEVTVGGEVVRPGTYSIERGDTIADLVARAGGLTKTAYPLGAVLSRSSLVESERASNFELAKQLRESMLLNSQSDDNRDEEIAAVLGFAQELEGSKPTGRQVVNIADGEEATFVLLEDGDRLVVPKRPSHVRVIGAVYSELAALYREGASPMDYVDDAGGLTRFADPRRSFIILPNGRSIPVNLRRNGSSVPVPPGSVIVVPPKLDRVSTMQLTEGISRALGSIASSVLALDVLSGQ